MRLRRSSLFGTLDVDLGDSDATISSPELADLPDVAYPDFLPLILDAAELGGEPEIAYVTAHTSGDPTATITRGEETSHGGSAARDHLSGVGWVHGPTPGEFIADFDGLIHSTSTDPIRLVNQVGLTLDDDITAFTTNTEITEATLILLQGTGGVWVDNLGISIAWATSAPTLSVTPGNFDVIRLTRLSPDGSLWFGEIAGSDLSLP